MIKEYRRCQDQKRSARLQGLLQLSLQKANQLDARDCKYQGTRQRSRESLDCKDRQKKRLQGSRKTLIAMIKEDLRDGRDLKTTQIARIKGNLRWRVSRETLEMTRITKGFMLYDQWRRLLEWQEIYKARIEVAGRIKVGSRD